ncbi:potassium transporter Trk [Microbacterium sp.]|uniref:potassium transporter Trk n=1 Tax=Microbacterium sp. TaxID=51671 RepID=UPI003C730AC7
MTPPAEHHLETARLRRSPRYGVFLAAGAALGILVALILTFAFDGTDEPSAVTGAAYSSGQVFGFLCLFGIPLGLALGGAVALILDRTVGRRTRDVRVDVAEVGGSDPADS